MLVLAVAGALVLALLLGGDEEPGADPGLGSATEEAVRPAERGEGGGEASSEPREGDSSVKRAGRRLVFFGDSLAATGESPYPELLDALPGATVTNLSEPGTTSEDWRPGTQRFDAGLVPQLGDADAALVTLGGNDLEAALAESSEQPDTDAPRYGPEAAGRGGLQELGETFDRIRANLSATFSAIRTQAPRAEVVFVGYPPYGESSEYTGGSPARALAARLGVEAIEEAARQAGADRVISPAAEDDDADRLIADREYLSPAGHRLYAERLARALGL